LVELTSFAAELDPQLSADFDQLKMVYQGVLRVGALKGKMVFAVDDIKGTGTGSTTKGTGAYHGDPIPSRVRPGGKFELGISTSPVGPFPGAPPIPGAFTAATLTLWYDNGDHFHTYFGISYPGVGNGWRDESNADLHPSFTGGWTGKWV